MKSFGPSRRAEVRTEPHHFDVRAGYRECREIQIPADDKSIHNSLEVLRWLYSSSSRSSTRHGVRINIGGIVNSPSVGCRAGIQSSLRSVICCEITHARAVLG